MDVDNDGVLSLEEASVIPDMTEERFNELDVNDDGYLSKEELPPPPDGQRPHSAHSALAQASRTGPPGGRQLAARIPFRRFSGLDRVEFDDDRPVCGRFTVNVSGP